ncbi:Zn-ribbon domain-containing OB-fold protein [Bacillus testis]|uniref:Zn-ribbon domain-containing OB-fold protein n=1 Tax=Bacillus testis TaxID=1622072 RepID=UPI00067EBBFC|nr:Zn-ribbon domain-containing OB-fold protein [Bacillus testis]
MVRYNKEFASPRPMMDVDTKPFWDYLKEKKDLYFQRCANCHSYMHPPRPICNQCKSFDMEWVPSSGKGTIYSYVVYHRPVHPGFEVPYEVVLVEMEEGVRIVSNMVDCEPEDIYIGMPVELVIDEVADDLVLPKFKRRNT